MTPETINIDRVVLSRGSHSSAGDGMDVMELASLIAREPFSDRPACVSPLIGDFLRSWNDALDDKNRQKLKPYVSRVIGTADGKDIDRAWLVLDWMVRVYLPIWLAVSGMLEEAEKLRSLNPVKDKKSASAARSILNSRALARALALDLARALARALALDRALARDLALVLDLVLDLVARDCVSAVSRADKGMEEKIKQAVEESEDRAFALLDQMIDPGKVAA